MSKKIRCEMPDGELLDANYPVDSENWTFENGKDFLRGLMQKAFPSTPGTRQDFIASVENGDGGLMLEISVNNRTLTVGPFETTVAGMDGLTSAATFKRIERKDRAN